MMQDADLQELFDAWLGDHRWLISVVCGEPYKRVSDWVHRVTKKRLYDIIKLTSEGLEVRKRSDERNILRVLIEEEELQGGDDPEDPILENSMADKAVWGWSAWDDTKGTIFAANVPLDADINIFTAGNPKLPLEEPDHPVAARFPLNYVQPAPEPEPELLPHQVNLGGDSESEVILATDDAGYGSDTTARTLPRRYKLRDRSPARGEMSWDRLERLAWGDYDSDAWDQATVVPKKKVVKKAVKDRVEGDDSKAEEASSGHSAVEPDADEFVGADPFEYDSDDSEQIGGANIDVLGQNAPKETSGSVAYMLGLALALATIASVMN